MGAAALASPLLLTTASPLLASSISAAGESVSTAPPANALHPDEWRPFELINVSRVSHDTNKYTFGFSRHGHPAEGVVSGLEAASLLLIKVPGPDGACVYKNTHTAT